MHRITTIRKDYLEAGFEATEVSYITESMSRAADEL